MKEKVVNDEEFISNLTNKTVDSLMQYEALINLLIKKNIITKDEIEEEYSKISQEQENEILEYLAYNKNTY
ncbi:hypothetical protein NRP93_001087 [Clostridium botulinum]|nr:hypothetical protein [Clostridium botulinum]